GTRERRFTPPLDDDPFDDETSFDTAQAITDMAGCALGLRIGTVAAVPGNASRGHVSTNLLMTGTFTSPIASLEEQGRRRGIAATASAYLVGGALCVVAKRLDGALANQLRRARPVRVRTTTTNILKQLVHFLEQCAPHAKHGATVPTTSGDSFRSPAWEP